MQKIKANKKAKVNDIEYLPSLELDRIIYECCGRFDKNAKYEYRGILSAFNFIGSETIYLDNRKVGFTFSIEKIEEYLKTVVKK